MGLHDQEDALWSRGRGSSCGLAGHGRFCGLVHKPLAGLSCAATALLHDLHQWPDHRGQLGLAAERRPARSTHLGLRPARSPGLSAPRYSRGQRELHQRSHKLTARDERDLQRRGSRTADVQRDPDRLRVVLHSLPHTRKPGPTHEGRASVAVVADASSDCLFSGWQHGLPRMVPSLVERLNFAKPDSCANTNSANLSTE